MKQSFLGTNGWISWKQDAPAFEQSLFRKAGFHLADSTKNIFSDDSIFLQLSEQEGNILLLYQSKCVEDIQNQVSSLPVVFSSHNKHSLVIDLSETLKISVHSFESEAMAMTPLCQLRTAEVDILYQPHLHPNKILGIFGEVALSVENLLHSLDIFHALGFRTTELHQGPYPWAIITDGIHTIGMHQTEGNILPGLVYYSPMMTDIANYLEQQGLSIRPYSHQLGGLPTWIFEIAPGRIIYLCQM